MSSVIRTDFDLERPARLALVAQKEILRLTAEFLDPAKSIFRAETEIRGKGFTYPVTGMGKIATRSGSPASSSTTYVLDPTRVSDAELRLLLKTGAVTKKVSERKASEPSVSFQPNV